MSIQSVESRCIYCSSLGPFSDEHMIPAGLGADDNRYLLRDMVCKTCNTTVFSPLELEWLRNSPTAIGRIFMQAEGRKRGSKKNPPKLGAGTKVVVTPEGYTAEAEIGYEGKATILPQMILVDEHQCSVTGSNKEEFNRFISQVHEGFGSSIACASKLDETATHKFQIATFVWEGGRYVEHHQVGADELPASCFLHLPIVPNEHGKFTSNSRLFRRPNGQIVLRLRGDLQLDSALTAFRKVGENLDLSTLVESDLKNPLVNLGFSFQLDVTGRVLAKTGLNILGHLLGADYVGHPAFQSIKKSIMTGKPSIPPYTNEAKAPFRMLFSGLPNTHHGFLLSAHPWHEQTCGIGMATRLYGSQIEVVPLGHGLPHPPIDLPMIFTVDYGKHLIEQYGLMDYMRKYPITPSSPSVYPELSD
ncbi:HNH endonuclease [Burkholderia sp. B21-005]|uniref:HNH endonuclease n=1 Tax=Burkholderia sp. B21-005 TaxID=2890406 RepID=UPI001E394E9B|nr:HNH endonuclease [Burkholderia sp. B21-005]UEP41057.1 HNH endonuclease [Burkholderia sp. B21-005]